MKGFGDITDDDLCAFLSQELGRDEVNFCKLTPKPRFVDNFPEN